MQSSSKSGRSSSVDIQRVKSTTKPRVAKSTVSPSRLSPSEPGTTKPAKIAHNNRLREDLTARLVNSTQVKPSAVKSRSEPQIKAQTIKPQVKVRASKVDYSAYRLKKPFTGKVCLRNLLQHIQQEDELPLIGISVDAIFGLRDFGAAQFLIYDTEPHGGECNVSVVTGLPPGCPTTYASEFFEYLTINPVVLTEGCFLVDKFNNIIEQFDLPDDIFAFTQKMALYAYTRLFLSYLLYGTFDIKWLAQQYNDQFLADLAASRYAKFLVIFTDPSIGLENFWQYFVPTFP